MEVMQTKMDRAFTELEKLVDEAHKSRDEEAIKRADYGMRFLIKKMYGFVGLQALQQELERKETA